MKILPNKVRGNIIDLSRKAYLLDPSRFPFYAFVGNFNGKEALNTEVAWLEETPPGSGNLQKYANYLQIFIKSIPWTTIFPEDRVYQRKKKVIELLSDMERCFIYGIKQRGLHSTTMGGLKYWLKDVANHHSCIRLVDGSTFSQDLIPAFKYGSSIKYLFANAPTLQKIQTRISTPHQIFYLNRAYGISTSSYLFSLGTLNFVADPMMCDNEFFVADLQSLVYRYLGNYDMHLEYIGTWERAFCECCIHPTSMSSHWFYEIL